MVHARINYSLFSQQQINTGRIRGMFFCPRNMSADARTPGIVDMRGAFSGADMLYDRAPLLAACGYAVLRLLYFDHSKLPQDQHLHLEYFQVFTVILLF